MSVVGAQSLRHGLATALVTGLFAAGCDRSDQAGRRHEQNAGAPVEAARVLNSFPRGSDAFTQGLVFHEGALLESVGGYGTSALRKLGWPDGNILQHTRLSGQYFGEGVTVLGGRAYQLTWRERTGFIYDLTTLETLGSFSYEGEGWGLTTDGRSLIMSDGTHVLHYLDPATFDVVRTLRVSDGRAPVGALNELEWIHGEIWANVWREDRIARIDPGSGRVLAWLDLAHLAPDIRHRDREAVANGIAYDEKTRALLVTGKLWPVIYELAPPVSNSDLSE